jgi:hypothetical protein
MPEISRRDFVKSTAAAAAALHLPSALRSLGQTDSSTTSTTNIVRETDLHWLEGGIPALSTGVTWGVPWPRGTMKTEQSFSLKTDQGEAVPVQNWTLATWPDGSLKWSAHAIGSDTGTVEKLLLAPGSPAAPAKAVTVNESGDAIDIDTGVIRCRVRKQGQTIIEGIERDGKQIATAGRLVCLLQNQPSLTVEGSATLEKFDGMVHHATLEQRGPVRAVVKLEGKHEGGPNKRAWLPFTVRLYFYAGSEAVRIMHSFVFDGDEKKDFIRGLGVTFSVPMRDLLHDRHVRFMGEGKGVWGEGVRNLSGLRRDPGAAVLRAQFEGKPCPPLDQFPANVRTPIEFIPAWNDYSLFQPTADSFEIRKRTSSDGVCWLNAIYGRRAAGLGYIGGATGGGVAFGARDFWQRHPTQLDIRGATTNSAEFTVWLWSPEAQPMDLRYYDKKEKLKGAGYDQQIAALDIIYEDYEEGFATPFGIARSSELMLWALSGTPMRERLVEMADALQTPPLLVCNPERYHEVPLFGALWGLPDRSTPAKKQIEEHLDNLFDYYHKQVDERHWYGFWNYGDIMHTYDKDRHVWRYDVGGYAWDNSELSSDLWLWFSFLRTGRADIFRMAEAMTRHTGEVDVYHLGRFAGLGSRHNVNHWGDSAKQVRVSVAEFRRPFFYLTADERVGDLMHELIDADYKLLDVDPVRKLFVKTHYPTHAAFGPDWTSFASNWLTEWERTGNTKYRDKILTGMKCLGAMRNGFLSGPEMGYNPNTGELFELPESEREMVHPVAGRKTGDRFSHLAMVFGGIEICAELVTLLDVPEFDKVLLQYCELYNGPTEDIAKVLGFEPPSRPLTVAHSRMTAYAAWRKKDSALAQRAWSEFYKGESKAEANRYPLKVTRVEPPAVLAPVDEAPAVSTNDTSQWALAAMENLSLIGDYIPVQTL